MMEHHDDLPPEFFYLIVKAGSYLSLGPCQYRKYDAFNMPPEDLGDDDLEILNSGMKQLVEGKGTIPESPLTGLGIPGFYLLLSTLHFKLHSQQIYEKTANFTVDEMLMQHEMTGQEIVLYNAVDTDQEMIRALLQEFESDE